MTGPTGEKDDEANQTGYGTLDNKGPDLPEAQLFEDRVTAIGGITGILGCCLVLPYMIYGVVLAMLSGGVPRECQASLHAVFLGLGLTYVAVSLLLGTTFSCGARNVVQIILHLINETQFEKEGCPDEADIEAAEAKRAFQKTVWLWPCCIVAGFGAVAIAVGWVWGIFEAVEGTPGKANCGSSAALFWVMLVFMLITKYCLIQLATYCNPALWY